MAKVIGVGGVFFKARDGAALREWYAKVLGLEFSDWGGVVFTPAAMHAHAGAATVLCTFSADTEYFAPSTKDYMLNLAVDDLAGVLQRASEAGVTPVKMMENEANGSFAHILDPEGNKIELWQPRPMA